MHPGPAARKPDLGVRMVDCRSGAFAVHWQQASPRRNRYRHRMFPVPGRWTSSAPRSSGSLHRPHTQTPRLPGSFHGSDRKSQMDVDRATFSAHMTITRATEDCHGPGPVHNNCAPQGWAAMTNSNTARQPHGLTYHLRFDTDTYRTV